MTAQILHIRDYKTAEERQLEIDRMGLAAVERALDDAWKRAETTSLPQYRAPDDGDCA